YTGTPGVNGHMIDLNAWLDANNPTEGAKWILDSAWGINDAGLITGIGAYNDSPGSSGYEGRAFLLAASCLLVPGPAWFWRLRGLCWWGLVRVVCWGGDGCCETRQEIRRRCRDPCYVGFVHRPCSCP